MFKRTNYPNSDEPSRKDVNIDEELNDLPDLFDEANETTCDASVEDGKDLTDVPIGKVSSIEKEPSSSLEFTFWTTPGVLINPFDYVSVENQGGSRTIGVVKEIMAPTDASSHLTNFVSSNFGDPTAAEASFRINTVVAKTSVVGNTGISTRLARSGRKPIWYPVLNNSPVKFASQKEIEIALGIHNIPSEYRLPAGIIRGTSEQLLPLYLDVRYVLGPEAAHVNVSGISGLAAKTSYLMFLLKAIMCLYLEDTAAIVFNVKQRDLLFIDELPEKNNLDEFDINLYEALGIDPTPFDNVTYYLPYGHRDVSRLYSSSTGKRVNYYAYALGDVYDKLELLMSHIEDPNFTIASINDYIQGNYDLDPKRNRLVFKNDTGPYSKGTYVVDWDELKWFSDFPQEVIGSGTIAGNVLGRFKRHLRLSTRGDIFIKASTKARTCHGIPIVYLGEEIRTSLRPGSVWVIDIQPFESQFNLQGFIVGDVIRTIKQVSQENRSLLPKNIVILIDELNRYAPTGTKLTTLGQEIIDMSRVGRGEGISLFTAQQFASEVHHQVYENCSTNLFGITGATELARSVYNFLDRETKAVISTLAPGEMILTNRRLRQPVRIEFPKPPFKRQQEDMI